MDPLPTELTTLFKFNKSVLLPAWVSFGWFGGDFSVILGWVLSGTDQPKSRSTHHQITQHKKDTRAGKWTLLLHFSTYSGHCIISHTFFLCSPLVFATCACMCMARDWGQNSMSSYEFRIHVHDRIRHSIHVYRRIQRVRHSTRICQKSIL